MKKKLFIATLVAIATFSFASCGHIESSDSSSTVLTTEQVEVEASINENGDAVLNPDDSNIEIEETESGDKIATIKSEDGSEVKVAIKEDSNGNTVIDTTKVVTDNGTVKKADNDSKTEVKVDDKGSVTVVTTIPDTKESESSSKPVVTTTYDPTVEPPKSITTTYDPTVTPKTTTTKTTTTPKATTTPTSTTPKETTTTPKVTTAPKPTTTTEPKVTTTPKATEAPKPTTTAHTHSWSPVYKTVNHDAEYQTKTYWMYMPAFYQGADPTHISFGPNRITPTKTGWYNRYTDYDLLCWYYGSLENVPNEYKVEWINKDTCGNYGLSSSAWNNVAKTGYDGLSIETTDYWGNKCTFNPNLDVLVTIHGDASSKAALAYDKQFGVSFFASFDSVDDCFMAVAQEQVKIKDAWTENVITGYECSCGAHK